MSLISIDNYKKFPYLTQDPKFDDCNLNVTKFKLNGKILF